MTRHGKPRAACRHGAVHWEGDTPACGDSECMWRWARRYAIPGYSLPVVMVIVGSLIWGDPIDCPPGQVPTSPDSCVARQ